MDNKKIARELVKIARELKSTDLKMIKKKLADYVVREVKEYDMHGVFDDGLMLEEEQMVEKVNEELPRKWTMQYRDRYLCVLYNIKGRGVPDIEVDSDEFDFVVNGMFIPELEKKIKDFTVRGRSGGYWGFVVDCISDCVGLDFDKLKKSILELSDKEMMKLIDRADNSDDYIEMIWQNDSDSVMKNFEKLKKDKYSVDDKFLDKVNKAEKEIERILKLSESKKFWLENRS